MMIKLLMVVPAIYQLVYTSSGKFEFSVQPIFEGGCLFERSLFQANMVFIALEGFITFVVFL